VRSRPSALVLCAGLVLLAGACSPQGDGTEHDLQDRLAAWEPQFAPCDTVVAYLDQFGQDFTVFADTQTAAIRIHLDAEGRLTASPKNVAIGRGDTIHLGSESLRWTMRFVADTSPLSDAAVSMAVAGIESRQDSAVESTGIEADQDGGQGQRSINPGEELSLMVSGDAACGRYHYVVGAYHPGEDEVHVLDPPLVISNWNLA
jgi:hypothetical protein